MVDLDIPMIRIVEKAGGGVQMTGLRDSGNGSMVITKEDKQQG